METPTTNADSLIRKYSGSMTLRASYPYSQVKHMVEKLTEAYTKKSEEGNSASVETIPKFKNANPSVIRKGDLFLGFSANGKCRPIVVAKVVKDLAYCIMMTTTQDEYTGIPHTSRFLEDGFYSNHFVVVRLSHIRKNFIGMIDDTRTLNKAIKLITNKLKKDFK